MKHRWRTPLLLAAMICWLACLSAATLDAQAPEVAVKFLGSTPLEQLAEGATGQGVLLYYLPQRGALQPSLAVELVKERADGPARARVFDAPPGKIAIPLSIEDGRAILDAGLTPALEIEAPAGWWRRAGLTNYNLDIQVNGPIYSMWGASPDIKSTDQGWRHLIKPGQPAVKITVRDERAEGLPGWELRLLIPAFPGRGYYRASYAERACQPRVTIDPGPVPEWPFVASQGSFEQSAGLFQPPIVVDWTNARVTIVGEFVTVRNQRCSYAFYSVAPVAPGSLNQLNFETPFAFYDLSEQGSDTPNLIVRAQRYPAGDPWSVGLDPQVQKGHPTPKDFETMRYSWRDAPGDRLWDYKIEVLGFHPYGATTSLAGGTLQSDAPGYSELPAWVLGRSWPVVTFVDTEQSSYRSSEGIYDWSPLELGVEYLFGWSDQPRLGAFSTIADGLRGEYRFRSALPPRLYLSPVDQQLHLLGAEGGLWNLGAGRLLHAYALDAGPYLNHWELERRDQASAVPLDPRVVDATPAPAEPSAPISSTGQIEASLSMLGDYLLYAAGDGVELRPHDQQLALFETLPPADEQSWRELHARMASYGDRGRHKVDLAAWAARLAPEPGLKLSGARISRPSRSAAGFEFALTLNPDFVAEGNALLPLAGVSAGDYLVSYDQSGFHLQPLRPANFAISLQPDPSRAPAANQVIFNTLTITNTGTQALAGLTLEVIAQHGALTQTLLRQPLELTAGAQAQRRLSWTPTAAGRWDLQVVLSGSERFESLQTMEIAPSERQLDHELDLLGSARARLPVLAIALLILGYSILIGLRVFQQEGQGR